MHPRRFRRELICSLLATAAVAGLFIWAMSSGSSARSADAPSAACARRGAPCPPADAKAPLTSPVDKAPAVPYSQLLNGARDRQVVQALLAPGRNRAWFTNTGSPKVLQATVPGAEMRTLADALTRQGATVRFDSASLESGGDSGGFSWWWLLALLVLPMLLIVGTGLLVGFLRSLGPAGGRDDMSLKGARKKEHFLRSSMTRFRDVAGCDEVVEEVQEFVHFLKDAERFQRLGAQMPSGLILHGPPGTGKTLVAKALAGEAGVPFFACAGSEFVEKYVGVGASRVRELFEDARRSPGGAVIFIDEIDAVGRRRGEESHPERDQALNELLTQMDGFPARSRLVVVAATNRLDVLDPALLRPGRFARQVRVGTPDAAGRLQILQLYAADKPLADDVDLASLAATTAGCTGADLRDMLNEAAIMAAREEAEQITNAHLAEGQLRALAGPVRRSQMTAEELEQVAHHEAGHVLCAELCEEHEKAQRASIRPRGQAGGLALYGARDRALHSARYLHEQLVCALGGRAAEWVMYGRVSSGAANDLQQANSLARQAVQELGFSQRAGQVIVSSSGRPVHVSDATRQIVDQEVERMVAEAYGEAVRLLEAHKLQLQSLAGALLKAEELDRLEILAALWGGQEAPAAATRSPQDMAPKTVPVLGDERPAAAEALAAPAGRRPSWRSRVAAAWQARRPGLSG